MTSVKHRVQQLLHRLFRWAFEDEIALLNSSISEGIKKAEGEIRKEAIGRLSAIQAIDFDPYDLGKIIIMARVNGQDIIRFIDIPREYNMIQYRDVTTAIEKQYGARAKFFDGPRGLTGKTGFVQLEDWI